MDKYPHLCYFHHYALSNLFSLHSSQLEFFLFNIWVTIIWISRILLDVQIFWQKEKKNNCISLTDVSYFPQYIWEILIFQDTGLLHYRSGKTRIYTSTQYWILDRLLIETFIKFIFISFITTTHTHSLCVCVCVASYVLFCYGPLFHFSSYIH